MVMGLDFETFSQVNLPKHGLSRYFEHPSTTVLCASVAMDNAATVSLNFVENFDAARRRLIELMDSHHSIVAHNAAFEMSVLSHVLDIDPDEYIFVDSAVIARAVGAAGKLEAAAPQLLGIDKIEMGSALIKIFSIPTEDNQGQPYSWNQIVTDQELFSKWKAFVYYCDIDAELSLQIYRQWYTSMPAAEMMNYLATQEMNNNGWHVDLDLVGRMQQSYWTNLQELQQWFEKDHGELNFNSFSQLKKWCADRGINASSFDATNLPKLRTRIKARVDKLPLDDERIPGYLEVLEMLEVKEELGGSSLTKLQTIQDQVSKDGRLRDQYLHIGAGQTYRTSGRGVQLQNLPRLGTLIDVTSSAQIHHATNTDLRENLRQVFTAAHPHGELIVADFSSVESRGLAFLAGEQWKLDAYAQGKDIYKMLATTYSSFGGVAYDDVTKEQRQAGKVGELACGYGAGPDAVAGFAEKMGIAMEKSEALQIVRDWRAANPEITAFWYRLDDMLSQVVRHGSALTHPLPHGGQLCIGPFQTPKSLQKQHPGARSIQVSVLDPAGSVWLQRVIHGCYLRGKDICYYKPSELKSGDLWRGKMTVPPHIWYKIYGGKLTGILTQSFCRELFFQSIRVLYSTLAKVENVKMIGQFHDELVLEWTPPDPQRMERTWSLDHAISTLKEAMTHRGMWNDFPLDASVDHDYRYLK